jgi:acyl carrier protein
VWEDLLGVHPIGAHDNFFELGGHSLLATRVLARVDDQFGIRLPLRSLFEAPTVRQLAELLAAQIPDAVTVGAAPTGDREEFEL